MSQSTLTFPDTNLPGSDLIDKLELVFAALASNRKGSSRPSDVQAGEVWLNDANNPIWTMKLWDGAQDISVFTINSTEHTITFAGMDKLAGGAAPSELTIADGIITPTSWLHIVDTQGDAAADDLEELAMTSMGAGRLVVIACADATRVVTVKHNAVGAVNPIILNGDADLVMDDTDNRLWLVGAGVQWVEVGRTGPWTEDHSHAVEDIEGLGSMALQNMPIGVAAEDLLVVQADGTLKRLAKGTVGQVPTVVGGVLSYADPSGGRVTLTRFTESGTFAVPSDGVIDVFVYAGAGGGGGYYLYHGGAGAPGGVAHKRFVIGTDIQSSQDVTVTVGAGGDGGAAQNNGSPGETSSFGSYCSANGGGGGPKPASGSSNASCSDDSGYGVGGDQNIAPANVPQPSDREAHPSCQAARGGAGGTSGAGEAGQDGWVDIIHYPA